MSHQGNVCCVTCRLFSSRLLSAECAKRRSRRLALSVNEMGKPPVALGARAWARQPRETEDTSELFQELVNAVDAGLWGVPASETCGQALPSSLFSEEHAFCANLGVARRSSSSEGLARAPGVSSEASLESNEVKLLLS